MNDLSWIEISRKNLKSNINIIKNTIEADTILAPCVKANAYGHGLVETASVFLSAGANWLCVNSSEEEQLLRTHGIICPVLIIGYVAKDDLSKLINTDTRMFLSDLDHAEKISNITSGGDKTIKVHIKIDTGMHRQGVLLEEIESFTNKVNDLVGIEIEGVATHFANSDEPHNPSYFKYQLEKFEHGVEIIKNIVRQDLIIHCDKSASAILYPHKISNLVRPGIATYGHYPGKEIALLCKERNINLLPALSFKTKIAQVKNVPTDSFVGYGCSFRTTRNTKIATIAVGYYDGYDRKLSNRGHVLVNGKRAPILGRVCMNITIIDITDCGNISKEDEVVLIGKQGEEEVTAEQIGLWTDTINYEVVTRLRETIPRYYI